MGGLTYSERKLTLQIHFGIDFLPPAPYSKMNSQNATMLTLSRFKLEYSAIFSSFILHYVYNIENKINLYEHISIYKFFDGLCISISDQHKKQYIGPLTRE